MHQPWHQQGLLLLPWCPTTVQYLNYPTPNQYPLHYWLHHPWLNGGVDMKGQMAQFCPYNLLITSGIGVLPSRSWKLLLRTTGWVSGEGKSCIDCKQGYSSLPISQMQQSLICSPILHGARTKVDTTLRCWESSRHLICKRVGLSWAGPPLTGHRDKYTTSGGQQS